LFRFRTDRYGRIYGEPRAERSYGWRIDAGKEVNALTRVIRDDGALYLGAWFWRDGQLSTGGRPLRLDDLYALARRLRLPTTPRRAIML
jgi:hypothetical protein